MLAIMVSGLSLRKYRNNKDIAPRSPLKHYKIAFKALIIYLTLAYN